MAITIDGVTYRNLQEQVGKNTEDIYDLRKNSARAVVKGETPLEKVHVTGESNLEGSVTAGGSMEVDGPLTVNGPSDVKFKEDNTSLSDKLDNKISGELQEDGWHADKNIHVGKGISLLNDQETVAANALEGKKVEATKEFVMNGFSNITVLTQAGIKCSFTLPADPMTTRGVIALTKDIVYSKIYRHTITISGNRQASSPTFMAVIVFTTYSTDYRPIDSAQDLFSAFGNTDFAVTGGESIDGDIKYNDVFVRLHIGKSISDCSIVSAFGLSKVDFSAVFSQNLTITDSVIAL